MEKVAVGRPEDSEFADYQTAYVSKVPGTDVMDFLQRQLETTSALLRSIPENKGDYRYGPDKWTVKELLGHIIDTERVFAYRALTFARNDSTALPGFDQEPWAQHANHARVPLRELTEEFETVRRSTIHLFRNLDAAAWMRRGTANNIPLTVRSLAYLIAGHAEHHFDILKTRYQL